MNQLTEIVLLNRELDTITIEYYRAPFNLKCLIINDMLLIQKTIEILLKEAEVTSPTSYGKGIASLFNDLNDAD